MKKLLALCMFVSLGAIAQPLHTEKSIVTVSGSAKQLITPDMTELNIHLSVVKMNMADATKQLGDQTQHMLKTLRQLGFQESDVKTTHFSASKNVVYRNNGYADSGYVVSQDLTLKFSYNEATLQKIAARFSEAKDPVNFSIAFFLSDALQDKTAATLQANAVADARKKATNLSSAAGMKLGTVRSISYGADTSDPILYRKEMHTMSMSGDVTETNLSFAPQEIEMQESVTLVWELQ